MPGSNLYRLPFSVDRRPKTKDSFRGLFFFIPASLALITCMSIIFHIFSTSNLVILPQHAHHHLKAPVKSSTISSLTTAYSNTTNVDTSDQSQLKHHSSSSPPPPPSIIAALGQAKDVGQIPPTSGVDKAPQNHQWPNRGIPHLGNDNIGGKNVENIDVFHDRDLFMKDYQEMNRSLRVYVYPHETNEPFANVLLPEKREPGGNYASESYFKKALFESHFITKNPSEADLFYLPFSIASLRHDRRVGVGGIPNFIRDYISNISHRYPYWNRTGGVDHFYVACHSIGKSAMDKAVEVKVNAIQVVCSSSYFLTGYVAHKDASIPQIWPRKGKPPNRPPSKRKTLAFYAGAMNSGVRKSLVEVWGSDPNISVHRNRLRTPYSEALLGSKFCIHAKGFEVNTARISDALYYGCVPVILADYYDLPFTDILNWKSFGVVVTAMDIPMLKSILLEKSSDDYLRLQDNVMKVQRHFQWHHAPIDFDAFYMVMYELWIRRSYIRMA